ncbi:MAG: hypothetical protein ACXWJ6_00585 [Xanthobacteraceae bacterium]
MDEVSLRLTGVENSPPQHRPARMSERIEGNLLDKPISSSREDIADYIAKMAGELRSLATEGEFKLLALLIQAVEMEAENNARELTGHNSYTRRMLRKFA